MALCVVPIRSGGVAIACTECVLVAEPEGTASCGCPDERPKWHAVTVQAVTASQAVAEIAFFRTVALSIVCWRRANRTLAQVN